MHICDSHRVYLLFLSLFEIEHKKTVNGLFFHSQFENTGSRLEHVHLIKSSSAGSAGFKQGTMPR